MLIYLGAQAAKTYFPSVVSIHVHTFLVDSLVHEQDERTVVRGTVEFFFSFFAETSYSGSKYLRHTAKSTSADPYLLYI